MICTCTRCRVVLSSCSSASMKRFLPRVGIARWLPPEPLVAKMLLSRGSSSFWTFFAFGLGGALLSSFSRWCLFTRFMSETRIIVLSCLRVMLGIMFCQPPLIAFSRIVAASLLDLVWLLMYPRQFHWPEHSCPKDDDAHANGQRLAKFLFGISDPIEIGTETQT